MEKLRILDVPWHLAHQNDICKIPNTKWFWLIQHRRPYSNGARGNMVEKYGIEWVPYYESGKYDLAILHLDQQCFENSLWERGKGSVYREMNETIQDIPKIVIMHGTPYYPEMFPCDITIDNFKELGFTEKQIGMSSELIRRAKEVIGNNILVCNSYRAKEQWGWGETIIHGMDAEEWLDLPKEPRVVTMISPGGLDRYYDRTFLRAVKDLLEEKDIEHCHITVDAQFKTFDEYREFLGRSLLYFNPTRESPMPRARTEAMFSGCCVITTPSQDADTFIKNGENGFLIKRNPEQVVNLIVELLNDYPRAVKIGEEGRKTALQIFSGDRYRNDWTNLINKVLNNYGKK
jgi:hypothetical protein